ncbi:DUF1801 domain-containing protein [Hyphomonas johnsonii]|uniref:YdhG-like domain-containing protein n=1 Tax=Hyphomonas johnsonii MHS-2 TaxID=1280950 RepID=A0A059FFQ8_9PROT|nr:DUF1801 domain-containing protein [Hyphomonas johnsonii]KCZ89465.1 hypothetical protein HJO_14642 [Hyphomonas johnsonii MHS-2]
MAGADNKTQPTAISPAAFIASLDDPRRKADAGVLLSWFEDVTGLEARMWGPSIIGFGRYRYKYATGREGEFLMTGFSPRKAAMSIYILPGYREMGDKLARLGKHKTGASCLYVKSLADIDLAVLREMVEDGLAYMRRTYETWDT